MLSFSLAFTFDTQLIVEEALANSIVVFYVKKHTYNTCYFLALVKIVIVADFFLFLGF